MLAAVEFVDFLGKWKGYSEPMEEVRDVVETEASYEYSSSSCVEESSSDIAEYEREYFGEESSEYREEEDGAAWEDSEEGEERVRNSYRRTATWIDGTQTKKQMEVRKKRLRFSYERSVFVSKCKIKLAKCHGDYIVVVDTYNIIYILRDLKAHRIFQIERFGVSDFVFINNMILFASCKQSGFKEVSFDGDVRNVCNRASRGVRMMSSRENVVYVVGEQLVLMNNNYEVMEVFEHRVVDICLSSGLVYVLDYSGRIFVLTASLKIVKKVSLDDKFDFKCIYSAGDFVVVGTGMGIKVFDRDMEQVKELRNMKDEVTGCVGCDGYIVYGSKYANSLKIMQPGLSCFNRFPFNSISIPPISIIDYDGRNIIICSGRSVGCLRMQMA